MLLKHAMCAALSCAAMLPGLSEAKGCLKGAAVGGVGGHFAGHHAVLGAAAGCAVGHHMAGKKDAATKAQNGTAQVPSSSNAAPAPPASPAPGPAKR